MKLTIEDLVEITFDNPDNFLLIKETLTRVGIASKRDNILFQSCHILHKKGRYAVVHFKELFLLDGKEADFNDTDKGRRNTIANLLEEWGLFKIVDKKKTADPLTPLSQIKVLSFTEKRNWDLQAKYTIGTKR